MMEKNLYPEIPKEKFAFIHKDERIHDEKLQTKSISYLGDAWLRFRKNKSSVVAFCLIVFLLLFAIITPFVSPYTVQFRDGYYKSVLPKNTLFENAGFWDGARKEKVSEIGYHYYNAIGQETGVPVVKKEYDHYTDSNGVTYYNLRVDSYALVGFAYVNLSETEYNNLMAYQNEKDIQVIYPLQKTHNSQYMMGNGGANFWYQLKDESVNTNGDPALDENGSLIPNYLTSDNPNKANYNSKRIAGDDGADGQWYTYAQKNQTGYRVRVHYLEYFRYVNGYEPTFIFGTNNYGQDIFTCLAVGARLSFLLSIVVASINFILGVLYGSIEGYYGGARAYAVLPLQGSGIRPGGAHAGRIRRSPDFQAHLPEQPGYHRDRRGHDHPRRHFLRIHAQLPAHHQSGNVVADLHRHAAFRRSGVLEHLPPHHHVPGNLHRHFGNCFQPVW